MKFGVSPKEILFISGSLTSVELRFSPQFHSPGEYNPMKIRFFSKALLQPLKQNTERGRSDKCQEVAAVPAMKLACVCREKRHLNAHGCTGRWSPFTCPKHWHLFRLLVLIPPYKPCPSPWLNPPRGICRCSASAGSSLRL